MSADPKPGLLRRLWLRAVATAGVTAAVLLSWWWKVEDARPAEDAPLASFGSPVDLGRSLLTPQALEWREGEGQFVMNAVIENVTGRTQFAVFGTPAHPPLLLLDGVAQPAPQVLLRRDDADLQQLQPRMPEEIALVWPAPAGWAPAPVEIGFDKQAFKLRDNLYGQSSWLGFAAVARMIATPETRP